MVFLVLGGDCLFVVAAVVNSQIPNSDTSSAYPMMLVKIALIMLSGPSRSLAPSLLWSVVGFLVAEVSVGGATLLSGGALQLDLTAIGALASVLVLRVVSAAAGRRHIRARERVYGSAREERAAQEDARAEMRASALLHDTVLSGLSAVAVAVPGRLAPDLRVQLQRDLDLLRGGRWLFDGDAVYGGSAEDGQDSNGFWATVSSAREFGLQIDVTGDVAALADLPAAREAALALAVQQCLVNVMKHSGAGRAEVVLARSETEVSVMVVDDGKGFVLESPSADRLGLRQSVARRVEDVGGSVRVWSAPGRGTSVMLRLPAS
ncbi:sensor histidine kinase [Glaciihabitans tibetensis]|nr:ATP-binding protein [Glaciihabitans tibetensis]